MVTLLSKINPLISNLSLSRISPFLSCSFLSFRSLRSKYLENCLENRSNYYLRDFLIDFLKILRPQGRPKLLGRFAQNISKIVPKIIQIRNDRFFIRFSSDFEAVRPTQTDRSLRSKYLKNLLKNPPKMQLRDFMVDFLKILSAEHDPKK